MSELQKEDFDRFVRSFEIFILNNKKFILWLIEENTQDTEKEVFDLEEEEEENLEEDTPKSTMSQEAESASKQLDLEKDLETLKN